MWVGGWVGGCVCGWVGGWVWVCGVIAGCFYNSNYFY